MSITQELINSLPRKVRLTLMAWLVESLQEDEQEVVWSPSEEQQRRMDETAVRMEQEGGKQITSAEFRT